MAIRNRFPDNFVPVDERGPDWYLQAAKAAWSEYSNAGFMSFYAYRDKYRIYADYAQSKQSVNKYKKILKAESSPDSSIENLNWQPLSIFTKLRELALAITKKVSYNVSATPIDPESQMEIQKFFKKQEAKIKIREVLDQIDPGFGQMSAARKQDGEAEDMDELEIQKMYTWKHWYALEVEQFLETIFYHNNLDEVRATVKQYIFDFGVGGVKEYIDIDGLVRIRPVHPAHLITSRFTQRNAKDADYIGEVIETNMAQLREQAGDQFTEEEYKNIFHSVANRQFVNESYYQNKFYDDQKVTILDLEFFSFDQMAHEMNVDKRGNLHITRSSPKQNKKPVKKNAYKIVCKCKWIVGTNYIFDYGVSTNMKRRRSNLQDTELSYHIFAPNFDPISMRCVGRVELAINIIDLINLAFYRLQHAIAMSRPKGLQIDIDGLQDVGLGDGGNELRVKDIIQIYNQTGNLLYRSRSVDGTVSNYRPIAELENGIGIQAQEYFRIIQEQYSLLRDIVGLNEATDSFTGSRTYGAAVEAAIEATNNSVYGIIEADREIMQSLSEALTLRIQTIVRSGNVANLYSTSLGESTLKFLESGKDIGAVEFGVKLDTRPSAEDRARFMMRLDEFIKAGQVDFTDAIMLENMDNVKYAAAILGYKIKKKRQKEEQQAMQMQQMNAQVQMQAAMAAEEEKRKTLQMEYELKMQLEQMKMQSLAQVEQLRLEAAFVNKKMESDAKITDATIRNESREYVAEIMTNAKKERNSAQVASDLVK